MATKKVSDDTTTVTNDQDSTNDQENITVDNTDTWTEPKNYSPVDGGNNILAAWQGLYWLFDARVERFDVTPEGVFVIGFRVNSKYDPDQIVKDISTKNGKTVDRRLDLVPHMFWAQGQEPEIFPDSGSMTQYMAQYARGAGGNGEGESNRSPEYFKTAIADYKKQHGMTARRGRPPKTVKIESLGSIDPSVLAGLDPDELDKFIAVINQAKALHTPATK